MLYPYNTVTPVYFSYYFLTGTCTGTVPVRDGCEVRLCDPFPAPPGVLLPERLFTGTVPVGPTEHLQFNEPSWRAVAHQESISIQATAGALFPSS